MTNEELAAIRTIMREETNASEQRMRALMREEVNATVYASEQRLGALVREEVNASEQRISERLDRVEVRLGRVEERLDGVEGRLDRVDGRLDGVEGRLGRLETKVVLMDERLHRVEFLQTQMAASLAQFGLVLNEASIKINELLINYIALDQKVEGIKRDIQKLMYRLDTADEAISGLSSRLKMHRDTPINEAHPHSAA